MSAKSILNPDDHDNDNDNDGCPGGASDSTTGGAIGASVRKARGPAGGPRHPRRPARMVPKRLPALAYAPLAELFARSGIGADGLEDPIGRSFPRSLPGIAVTIPPWMEDWG